MAGCHARNVIPMQVAPRCGASTRSGKPCAAPAVAGAARCRMHGGKGSGAPKGNQNARTHGLYDQVMQERRLVHSGLKAEVRLAIAMLQTRRSREAD